MQYDTTKLLKPSFLLVCLTVLSSMQASSVAPTNLTPNAARLYDANLIDKVIEKAYSYHKPKTPYRWGGEAYSGIDCSGLTHLSFRAAGITIPRNSAMQAAYSEGTYVPRDQLRRGDLIFFDSNKDGYVDHVGLVISGKGANVRFIHSSSTNRGVAINRLSESHWRGKYKSDVGKRMFRGSGNSDYEAEPAFKPIVYARPEDVPGRYPQTALRNLRARDIDELSNRELKIMKNEVYARHGYVFHVNPAMVKHFARQSWYKRSRKTTKDAGFLFVHALNDHEQFNVLLLQKWLETKDDNRELF